ncbi:MAG: hypothetical protein JW832_06365 [Deltaproteobacteria bacterium]|nr:hypothetical protein [Deltaproteobacteria bacterium]
MTKQTTAFVLILSMTLASLATPVMALPLSGPLATASRSTFWADGIEAARQLRAGDCSALDTLLDEAFPLLPPAAAAYAEDLRAAADMQQVQDGMDDFLKYAGNVMVLMGVVAILAGIQALLAGDLTGINDILLGLFFLFLGLEMLADVSPAPLPA